MAVILDRKFSLLAGLYVILGPGPLHRTGRAIEFLQAAELRVRYILQAPKLKISQEEMVTIPLIGSTGMQQHGVISTRTRIKAPVGLPISTLSREIFWYGYDDLLLDWRRIERFRLL
ncbi:hypothetical protein V6N11_075128 [Hibiscus sabdariffa]|uniref:Uncharacterized protein n=1 Tax=Hibiscus sabdariffa TaxID=183260 RepID=A0ABR2R616_9ROSI